MLFHVRRADDASDRGRLIRATDHAQLVCVARDYFPGTVLYTEKGHPFDNWRFSECPSGETHLVYALAETTKMSPALLRAAHDADCRFGMALVHHLFPPSPFSF